MLRIAALAGVAISSTREAHAAASPKLRGGRVPAAAFTGRDGSAADLGGRARVLPLKSAHHGREQGCRRGLHALGGHHVEDGLQHREDLLRLGLGGVAMARPQLRYNACAFGLA